MGQPAGHEDAAGYEAGGVTFTDRPVPMALPEYAAARASLIEYLSRRKDVAALFEYGSVSAPGLSDLDFVVVLANRPAPGIARYLDRSQLPADATRAMARATLMVMSEKDFRYITHWDDLRLVLRFGRPVETIRLEGRGLFLTEICRIVDWLPWQIARLTRVIATRRIPVVTTVGLLYSLTYSLGKLEAIFGIDHSRWRTFREQIADVRRLYMGDPETVEGRLAALVLEGHFVACDALRAFSQAIVGEGSVYGPPTAPEARLTVPGGVRLDFVARPGVPSPRDLVAAATTDTTVVHLPAALARHFAVYGKDDGIIGRALRIALAPTLAASEASCVATDMQEVLHARISACDRWASFLRHNEIPHGLFKFAWFFEQEMPGRDTGRMSCREDASSF